MTILAGVLSSGSGNSTLTDVEPGPSWPLSFDPQQVTAPAVVRAHVWLSPAEIAWTPDDRP